MFDTKEIAATVEGAAGHLALTVKALGGIADDLELLAYDKAIPGAVAPEAASLVFALHVLLDACGPHLEALDKAADRLYKEGGGEA